VRRRPFGLACRRPFSSDGQKREVLGGETSHLADGCGRKSRAEKGQVGKVTTFRLIHSELTILSDYGMTPSKKRSERRRGPTLRHNRVTEANLL